jgi:hypothetical protein
MYVGYMQMFIILYKELVHPWISVSWRVLEPIFCDYTKGELLSTI